MPIQIWEALKWVVIISTVGIWLAILPRIYFKYFFGDEVIINKEVKHE